MLALTDLPHSPEIERVTLACLVLADELGDPTLASRTAEMLTGDDFHDGRHRAIFAAVGEILRAEQAVNVLSVAERLRVTGRLDDAGGIVYLSSLADELPVGFRATEYVETLRNYTGRRRLVEYGQAVAQRAIREAHVPAVQQVVEATSALGRVEQETCRLGGEFASMAEVMADVPAHLARERGSVLGLPFGLPKLDERTLGFCPGQAIVIAGRPGQGKSAAVVQLVAHNLGSGKRGGVASLEMSQTEWSHRLLAHVNNIQNDAIRSNRLSPHDRWTLENSAREMADLDLVAIDDTPGNTAADIAARARRLKVAKGLDYLVIDYLQIMADSGRSENRQVAVAENMRAMKRLARELEIPVIVLSQLNRNAEEGNRRPRLSDLRESGAIEQDADIVLMLHHPDLERWATTEIIIAKNRSGSTGIVDCQLSGPTFRFTEITNDYGRGGMG